MNSISTTMARGTASSYCNQTRPPPAAKATKAGAPRILLVEHCVAIMEVAMVQLGRLPLARK